MMEWSYAGALLLALFETESYRVRWLLRLGSVSER